MKHLITGSLLLTVIFSSCNSTGDNTKVDSKDSTMTTTSSSASGDTSRRDTSSAMNNAAMSNNTGTTANTGSSGSSASSNGGATGTGSSSMNSSSAPADSKTIEFVKKAASGGMMEVQLGQVAQQNAKSERVKAFGSMMQTDHTNANNELKSLAGSKNIQIPTSMNAKDQKHVDEMTKMKGSAFDKMYMNMMVNDHKDDIADFKKASTSLKDNDIKNFAGKTLPVLEKHLDSATAIHRKM